MITSDRIRTALFWFLLFQCCILSISIAAASMSLALSIIAILVLIVHEKTWNVPRTPLDIAFLAYIVIEFITAVNSVNQPDAFKNSKRLLLIAIVYGVIISFDNRKKIEQSIQILVGTVSLLSLIEVSLFLSEGNDRLFVFQHYMTTGGLKMIVSLFAIPFIFSSDIGKKSRIFFTAALLPVLTALILTNTRSAWLGFLAGLIVMSGLYYRKLFAFIVALLVLFFLFAPQHQLDRAKSIVDPSHPNNVGRLTMWTTGLQMWNDKPLLGFGDIDLYESYSRYRTPEIDEPAGHLHNNYVHLLVTLGAIGFLIVIGLFVLILVTEIKIFNRYKRDALIRNIAIGGIAVFCGFLVNGIFEWNFGDHEIMVFVWFSVGLVLASEAVVEKHP